MGDSCRNLTPKKEKAPLRVSRNALTMPTWSSDSPGAPAGQRPGGAAVGKLLACSFWQTLPAIRALCFLFGLKWPRSIGRGEQGCLAEFSGMALGDPVTELARLGTTHSKLGRTPRTKSPLPGMPFLLVPLETIIALVTRGSVSGTLSKVPGAVLSALHARSHQVPATALHGAHSSLCCIFSLTLLEGRS